MQSDFPVSSCDSYAPLLDPCGSDSDQVGADGGFSPYLSAVIKAKKHLGQHFLKDRQLAEEIVKLLSYETGNALEVGPGTGVLTDFLLHEVRHLTAVELDRESVAFLKANYSAQPQLQILRGDFLQLDLRPLFRGEAFSLIGNFPYQISTQILFKALEHRDRIPELAGMFQKEVAERISASHGNKVYGTSSVLTQAFYEVTYCFSIAAQAFIPPPKVESGVIRLSRRADPQVRDPDLFFRLVKAAFGQRRKTLRNALKTFPLPEALRAEARFDARAEQLSVADFIQLAQEIGDARGDTLRG